MSVSIKKNVIAKFILNLFNIIIPLLVAPYIYRVLGADLNGRINFADSLSQYFIIFANFGIYQYGIREINKVRNNKEMMRKTFSSLYLITFITNIIAAVSYVTYVIFRYSNSVVYIACMITTVNFFATAFYVEWVNEATENYQFITIKTILTRFLYTVILFAIIKSSKDFVSYLILIMVINVINNLISFIYIAKKIGFDFSDLILKKHIKPMFLTIIISNSQLLFVQLDKVMLGESAGMLQVSYYSIAQKIITMISTLLLSVIYVTIPRLSVYLAQKQHEKYYDLLKQSVEVFMMLLFPSAIGIMVLSKYIVTIYGGAEYSGTGNVLAVFAVYMITYGIETILTNQIMYLKGKEKKQMLFTSMFGVLNFILNIVLVKLHIFNALNAIITTVIADAILILTQYIYIKYILKVQYSIFAWNNMKYLLISLIFIPVSFVFKFVNNQYIYIVLNIVTDCIIYFMFIPKKQKERILKRKIRKVE